MSYLETTIQRKKTETTLHLHLFDLNRMLSTNRSMLTLSFFFHCRTEWKKGISKKKTNWVRRVHNLRKQTPLKKLES